MRDRLASGKSQRELRLGHGRPSLGHFDEVRKTESSDRGDLRATHGPRLPAVHGATSSL